MFQRVTKCSKFSLLFYGDRHETNHSLMCCLLLFLAPHISDQLCLWDACGRLAVRRGLFYHGDPVHLVWSLRVGREERGQQELEIWSPSKNDIPINAETLFLDLSQIMTLAHCVHDCVCVCILLLQVCMHIYACVCINVHVHICFYIYS